MKDKIIAILNSETFNITDESGNDEIVISRNDFDNVAERILTLIKTDNQ